MTNLPNHFRIQIINLDDPALDHTPVLLQINTQAPSKFTSNHVNWPKFRKILSNNSHLNIKLKTKEDIDLAINTLTNNILLAKNNSLLPTLITKNSNILLPKYVNSLPKNVAPVTDSSYPTIQKLTHSQTN
jgi:hypothetical protein